MTWLFYANLEELRRYFQQQKTSSENIADVKPRAKQITLDKVVGLLARDYKTGALAFIPLRNLLRGERKYRLLKLEEKIYVLLDISIIPDRELLVLGDKKERNSPKYCVSIYNNKGKVVKEFEEGSYVLRVFYDGGKYLYHADIYRIKRIDLDTLVEETVVSEEKLEEIDGKAISWLQFKDGKWYVLIWNSDDTHTLYSTTDLKNVSNWKREIHWDIEQASINSFDFLPDGSIISTVPLEYLDINGRERIEVSKPKGYYIIYGLRVLPLNEREAYVFYGGREFIGYVLLRKGNKSWEVVKSKHIERLYHPIELVTKEGYEKVVKPLLE